MNNEIDMLRKNVFDNLQAIEEKDKQLDKYKNVIDKIKEDLIKTKKYNTRCQDTYGNELIKVAIDHINYLLELLEEVE